MITFIFGLLTSLLIPVILIYSLISPKRFNIRTKNNKDGKWSRKNFYFAVLVVWIVSIIILGTIAPDSNTDIDMDSIASDSGLKPDEYKVHDDGAIEIKAPQGTETYSPSIDDNNEIIINRATFNGNWPFNTEQGVVGCKDNAIYFISGRDTYALTGFSRAYSDRKHLNWIPLTPEQNFWLANPEIPGTKISVSNVISAGELLCK